MKINLGILQKLAAAAVASPLVIALSQPGALPQPFGKDLALAIGGIGVFVNWGHANSAQALRDYLRSVLAPEIPLLLSRIESLENPMVKDSIATLDKNLPLIKSALSRVMSEEDAAKLDQLAKDSQSILDALNDGSATATDNQGATSTPSTSTSTDVTGTTPVTGTTVDPIVTPVATAPIGGVVPTIDPNAVGATPAATPL